jgi:two-component system sensor histidine kinase RpfC
MDACMAAGADAYITKPVDAHHLLEKIAELAMRHNDADAQPPSLERHNRTVGFSSDHVFDRQALDNLANLGSGIEFVSELVEGFSHDSKAMLYLAEHAVTEQDYLGFREALHALKGGASDLGGVEFVRLCSEAEKLKSYEMSGPQPASHMAKINTAYPRLLDAMNHYLSRERDIR